MSLVEQWLAMHPTFQVMIAWPLVTGLLSFGLKWLATKSPTAAAILKASGFDAAGLVRALRGAGK